MVQSSSVEDDLQDIFGQPRPGASRRVSGSLCRKE
jgi:hypothetical protein